MVPSSSNGGKEGLQESLTKHVIIVNYRGGNVILVVTATGRGAPSKV